MKKETVTGAHAIDGKGLISEGFSYSLGGKFKQHLRFGDMYSPFRYLNTSKKKKKSNL